MIRVIIAFLIMTGTALADSYTPTTLTEIEQYELLLRLKNDIDKINKDSAWLKYLKTQMESNLEVDPPVEEGIVLTETEKNELLLKIKDEVDSFNKNNLWLEYLKTGKTVPLAIERNEPRTVRIRKISPKQRRAVRKKD